MYKIYVNYLELLTHLQTNRLLQTYLKRENTNAVETLTRHLYFSMLVTKITKNFRNFIHNLSKQKK